MSSIRGEDEEIIGGAGEGAQALPVLRDKIEQLVNFGKLPYKRLLFSDWLATLFNFFAFSYGGDMAANVKCPHCKRLPLKPYLLMLEGLPCYVYEDDPTLQKEKFKEPFRTAALPPWDDVLDFRLLRMQDHLETEAYHKKGVSMGKEGNFTSSYAMAKHIVAINDEEVSTFEALDWVRNATTGKTTRAFREEISLREPGYSLNFEVNCSWRDCGAPFSIRMPEDGSFFRQSDSYTRKFKRPTVLVDESEPGGSELPGLGGDDSLAETGLRDSDESVSKEEGGGGEAAKE
jgi:hypothetical protein